MAKPLYRFMRVLEYTGSREAVDRAIEQRQVKGTSPPGWNYGQIRIREAILGDVPYRIDTGWAIELIKSQIDAYRAEGREQDERIATLQRLLEEVPL
jgi:hypothetical protein